MAAFRNTILCSMIATLSVGATHAVAADAKQPPNVVVVFTDDQGYADLNCFGAEKADQGGHDTPNLDRIAADGVRMTDFYVATAVCSASRSALLTGCYNTRVGIFGALGPTANFGLHPDETTIAEVCKSRGYATAAFGKWHLGDEAGVLPTDQGFDEYFGLPYSNDMWPFHPAQVSGQRKNWFPDLPLLKSAGAGEKTIVNPKVTGDDQTQLTTQYTEHAVRFIEDHAQKEPFFLYLAHSMPHVPLYVSDKFAGSQPRGLYGDVISEIDWSFGEVVKALEKNGVSDNTFVIFTSDNGPWLNYGDHAGSAKPLREGKATIFEGGVRVPCVAKFPGRIPKGTVCSEPAMTIDLLPTIAGLIGADLPDRKIDGLDIWPLLSGEPNAKSPHDALIFYWGKELQAVRSGDWKLHFPHRYRHVVAPGAGGTPGTQTSEQIGLSLFNLRDDISESKDLAAEYPEVVARLSGLAEKTRQELGDSRLKITGTENRPVFKLTK